MNEAARMKALTKAALSRDYTEDYQTVLHDIESAARSGESYLDVDYDDDVTRRAVSAFLKGEGFHTRLMGEKRLFIHWRYDQ